MRPYAILVLLALAAPAAAQNVVANSSFTGGIGSWTPGTGASWDPAVDFGGSPSSGSLLGTQSVASASPVVVASQCLPAAANAPYSVGAHVLVATSSVIGAAGLIWFDTAGCTGSQLGYAFMANVSTAGIWGLSQPLGGNPTFSPAGTTSAKVYVQMTYTGSSATAHFDDVFFGPGTFPVELLSFDAE